VSVFVLRIVLGAWAIVALLLVLKATSVAAFGRHPGWPGRLLRGCLLAPFWPLALLSAPGRDAMRALYFYKGGVE